MQFHKHRIVPGHMGGTYESSNVIRVNVAMHAFLHKCLWEQHGRWQDKLAWQHLARLIPRETARVRATSEMGKQRWANDAAYRRKMVEAQRNVSPEERLKRSVKAKAQWSDPAFRARHAEGHANRWANPGEREAFAARMRGNQRGLGWKHDADARAKIGAASRSRWQSFSDEKKARIVAARVKSRRANKQVH